MSEKLADMIHNIQQTFAQFKAEQTKQIEEIKKGVNDPLQAEKVDKINAKLGELQGELDALNIKLAASQMAIGSGQTAQDPDYTQAFKAHVRKGEVQASLTKGADDEGGYLAPVEWDRTITNKLVQLSPMRQLAAVQTVSGAGFTKLYNMAGTASGWVGETDPRPATATSGFKSMTFGWGEIYANPAATQQLLDDSAIHLESWLADEVHTEFAKQESLAFLAGDGINKPFGLLTSIEGGANEKKHPFGPIKKVFSGGANSITPDALLTLIYDLPGEFTANATFAMNRKTISEIRKFKNGQGDYLWQPSYVAGQPSTLCGFPVVEVNDLPDIAANAHPILFGDFKQTYTIFDRVGVRVLRDPFTNKPYVMFYTTKRLGGGVHNPEPMRALRIAV